MRIPSDQTHFIHTIEHLAAARRELWDAVKNDDPVYMESVFESIDESIKSIARVLR
jgi:hypothetical protein